MSSTEAGSRELAEADLKTPPRPLRRALSELANNLEGLGSAFDAVLASINKPDCQLRDLFGCHTTFDFLPIYVRLLTNSEETVKVN
jgi:hypothetical protein